MAQAPLTGLCVGGPLNGQMLAFPGERYKTFKPGADGGSYAAPAMDAEVQIVEYQHWAVSHGPFPIDFWLPLGKDPSWAFRHILTSYQTSQMVETSERDAGSNVSMAARRLLSELDLDAREPVYIALKYNGSFFEAIRVLKPNKVTA